MTGQVLLGKPLSARELQVVELLADGLSNVEIGERLFLSELTVKAHLRRIGFKLGIGDRTGIVGTAFRSGLLKVPVGADPLTAELLTVARAVAAGRPTEEFLVSAARAVRVADARSGVLRIPKALSASVSASGDPGGSGDTNPSGFAAQRGSLAVSGPRFGSHGTSGNSAGR